MNNQSLFHSKFFTTGITNVRFDHQIYKKRLLTNMNPFMDYGRLMKPFLNEISFQIIHCLPIRLQTIPTHFLRGMTKIIWKIIHQINFWIHWLVDAGHCFFLRPQQPDFVAYFLFRLVCSLFLVFFSERIINNS